jgi:outer membrane protein assembly factor BamE (lipoprotein component of BamABCDE complex)
MKKLLSIACVISLFSSCVMKSPKYAGVEEVLSLKTGMTKDEVSTSLGIPPYDVKCITDTTSELIYKYRTTDRKTLPLFMKKTNGRKATGKLGDLFITYDKKNVVTNIRSCSDCEGSKTEEAKRNYTVLIAVIGIVAPSVLIYLGIKKAT